MLVRMRLRQKKPPQKAVAEVKPAVYRSVVDGHFYILFMKEFYWFY